MAWWCWCPHQCGPGSNPRHGIMLVEFGVGSHILSQKVFLTFPEFPQQKPTDRNSNTLPQKRLTQLCVNKGNLLFTVNYLCTADPST